MDKYLIANSQSKIEKKRQMIINTSTKKAPINDRGFNL